MDNFERKLMKFWIQSFLLGVPKIIVGFRSPDGILVKTQEIETTTIPASVQRRGKVRWDGNVCINFASAFLECRWQFLFIAKFCHSSVQYTHLILGSFIYLHPSSSPSPSMFYPVHLLTPSTGLRQTITDEGVWRIRCAPKSQYIEVFKVEEVGHGNIITDEFMNWRIKLSLGDSIGNIPMFSQETEPEAKEGPPTATV